MSVNFLPKTKGFFPHDFTLIASVVGESVIGHGNGIRYIRFWRVSLRPDAGVSDDRHIYHHPISQPFTTSDGSKIQVRLRHILRKDPTISYVEYLTNLSNESWTRGRGSYLEADLLREPSELRMYVDSRTERGHSILMFLGIKIHGTNSPHACRNTRRAHQISSLFLA